MVGDHTTKADGRFRSTEPANHEYGTTGKSGMEVVVAGKIYMDGHS